MSISNPPWLIRYDHLNTKHSFFISHVQEDESEVQELRRVLDARLGSQCPSANPCFLDIDDWPKGRRSLAVIRERLLASQFLVAWISSKYLKNQRGWIWYEAAYGQLIEASFNYRQFDLPNPFVVPVYRNVTLRQVERTPWLDFWSRRLFTKTRSLSISEIADGLVEFYLREMAYRIKL